MRKLSFYLISLCMAISCTALFTACGDDDDDDDRKRPGTEGSYGDDSDDDDSDDEGGADWFTCVMCKGRGTCHRCGGDGVDATGRECGSCDGTGVCDRCGGSGRIYY